MTKIKDVYTSRYTPDGVLAQFDLSQIEIVVLAFLSQDSHMIQDLKDDVDFHCKRLAWMKKIDYDHLLDEYKRGNPETAKARKDVKAVSFQLSYGASPRSVSESTGIPLQQVKDFIRAENDLYPRVSLYYEQLLLNLKASPNYAKRGETKVALKSSSGKEYEFTKKEWGYEKPKLLNYPIQGLAAEIIKLFIQYFYKDLHSHFRNDTIKMINTTHDDILFDCNNDITAKYTVGPSCRKALRRIPNILSSYLSVEWNVPIKATLHCGSDWGNLVNQIDLEK